MTVPLEDPAEWIVELLRTRWDTAVDTLREDGVTYPKATEKPAFKAESSQGAAAYRLNNSTLIKVWRQGPEATRPAYWGYRGVDRDAEWVVGVWVTGPNARKQAFAVAQTIERVLELYRIDPQDDWDLIDGWRTSTLDDWQTVQRWIVQFRLSRRGRLLRAPVNDPQT